MISIVMLAFGSIILLFFEQDRLYSSAPANHSAFQRTSVFDGMSKRSPSGKTPQEKSELLFLPAGHKSDFSFVCAFRLANR